MEEINEAYHMQLLDFDTAKRNEWVKNRKPFSVLFELTPRCNMHCVHCYLQNHHTSEQLSFQEIIEIIDILYHKGILFLTFTGGEILTRTDFLSIYLYAKRKGFLVELFTNGVLFTDEIISVLGEYPPLLVDVSIYGASDNIYEKITGMKGTLECVIGNCKKIKDAGVRVSLKSPIMNDTLPELLDMKKIAEDIGIPFVCTFEICNTIDKSDKPKEYQAALADSIKYEFNDYYDQIDRGERLAAQYNSAKINELLKNEYVYSCNVALNSFVIDFQGNMCPCMKLRHRGVKLLSNNYDEIWEGFSVYSNMIASDSYVCKTCEAQYYCDVCPAEMEFLYDDVEYRPVSVCMSAKIRKGFYDNILTFEEAVNIATFYE